jgi:hypothetical protein
MCGCDFVLMFRHRQVDRMRKLFKVLCYAFHDLDSCTDGWMKKHDYATRAKLERDCELGEWKFSAASNEFPFYTDECVFASRV